MVSQRDSYYREKASRMYQSAPYAMTFGISEFPYLVAYTLLHCGILWGLVDFFPQDGYGFWYYACYFFLFISLLTYMAQFLAAALELTPRLSLFQRGASLRFACSQQFRAQ